MKSFDLARNVNCGTRSLFLAGRVIGCIKAARAEDQERLAAHGLLESKYLEEGWKQISSQQHYVLESLNIDLEVKTYPEALWKDVEEELYDEDSNGGSHNQILSRLLSVAGGTAEGSNRTETMNYCADLLGFEALEDVKWRIWDEHFALVPSDERIAVHYGQGKEFKLDKIWARKKEANCLEALMGALHSANYLAECRALAALAALCHLAPPDPKALVPSNWWMAEKVLDNAEKMQSDPEFFGGYTLQRQLVRKFLDQKKFQSQMEQWMRKKGNKLA